MRPPSSETQRLSGAQRLSGTQRLSGAQRLSGTQRRLMATAVAGLAATGAIVPAALSLSSAGASTVTTLQGRAKQIAARLDAVNAKLGVLGEEYDQAKLRFDSLDSQIAADKARLTQAEGSVLEDRHLLRDEAVAAYVSAGTSSGFAVMMSSSIDALPLQQTYMQVASSSLRMATTSLQDSEHRLTVRAETLSYVETQAAASEATLASAKHSAATLIEQLSVAEQDVKGKLALAVAEQEQVQEEQAAARAAAQRAAAQTVREAASLPSPPIAPPTPVVHAPVAASGGSAGTVSGGSAGTVSGGSVAAGGSPGSAAVRAAESQLGVPYVWGGATPGEGFDCSGLAMWAWGQAGVGLPHSAQAQYDSIEHVSLNDLQPGDLIFYASGGYIYHVIMYIGGGEAVQAENTGTVIQETPVWGGAYAAGRP